MAGSRGWLAVMAVDEAEDEVAADGFGAAAESAVEAG